MIAKDAALELFMDKPSAENRALLVAQYAYLRARAARKFHRPGLERADLEQIAAIGLLKACDRYNPLEQTPFEAFAWLFIVGELMHFVRDHERVVRPPRRLRALERRVHAANDELTALLGRAPRRDEIAQHLGITVREVEDVAVYNERALAHSLDGLPAQQVACAPHEYACVENAIVLDRAFERLTAVERAIIVALYARGYNQVEVAERMGYSRRHISRLHRTALEKMQSVLVPDSSALGTGILATT